MPANKQKETHLHELDNYLILIIASYLTLRDAFKFSAITHRYHDVITPYLITPLQQHTLINRRYKATGTMTELKKFFLANSKRIDSAKKTALRDEIKGIGTLGATVILAIPLMPILLLAHNVLMITSNNRAVLNFIEKPFELSMHYLARMEDTETAIARLRNNPDQNQEEAAVVITKLQR